MRFNSSGRCETPEGVARMVRPRRLTEEAKLTLGGKGASCNGNQYDVLAEPINKKYSILNGKKVSIDTNWKI